MQRMKTLGLMFLVAFAIGAITATAASAEELRILPEGTTLRPVTFNLKGGKARFTSGIAEVECETSTGTGKITSSRLGLDFITYRSCRLLLGGSQCRGLSDLPGFITVHREWHYRRLLGAESKHIVPFFLFLHVHFTCGSSLFLWLGCPAALMLPAPNTLVKESELHFQVNAGRQAITEGDTDNETGMETCNSLKASVNEGTEQSLTEETEETLEGFEQGGSAVTILVMA